VVGALAGVTLFARALVSSGDFVGSGTDLVTMEAPLTAFATSWIHRGVWPTWLPFVGGGIPFPAGTRGYYSPLFWIGLLLSDAGAIKLQCAASLALAGAGAAWFCRSFVRSRVASGLGGALFATSGFFAAHLYAGHLELVAAAAFTPWMAGLVDRVRRGTRVSWAAGVACFGLALLAAHAQMFAIGCVGAAMFAFAAAALEGTPTDPLRTRAAAAARGLGGLAGLAAGGAMVAAVQVLPLIETLPYTQRQSPGEAFTGSFAAAPGSLVACLLPGLLAGRGDLPWAADFAPWESFTFVGVVSLAIAGVAVSARPWRRWTSPVVVAVVAALLALGQRTPLLRLLTAVAPPFAHFRAPGRFLVITTLALALLAALGLDAIVEEAKDPRLRQRRIAGAAAVGALTLLVAGLVTQSEDATLTAALRGLLPVDASARAAAWEAATQRVRDDATLAVLAAGIGVAGVALVVRSAARARAATMLAAVAVLDVVRVGAPLMTTAPHESIDPIAPLVEHLREAVGPGGRVLPTPELVAPNLGAPHDLGTATAYAIFLDDRFARFANRALGRPLDAFATVVQTDGSAPLFRHLGIGMVLSRALTPGPDGRIHLAIGDFRLVGGLGSLRAFVAETPVPRAALVHAVERVATEEDAYARMEDPSFDLRQRALVESEPSSLEASAPPDAAAESVHVTTYEPDRVVLKVDARAPGLVVLSDVYEPGWTAEADGAPSTVLPVDRVMRGVPVKVGTHEVVMSYVAPGARAGRGLSGLGLLLVVALAMAERRRGRATASTPPGTP
jgi:hypothetical protein